MSTISIIDVEVARAYVQHLRDVFAKAFASLPEAKRVELMAMIDTYAAAVEDSNSRQPK